MSKELHLAREKNRARELRASQWWRAQIGPGVCYHCRARVGKESLTMDHLVPLSKGGKSTKKNVVPSCKECNNLKKNLSPAAFEALRGGPESRVNTPEAPSC